MSNLGLSDGAPLDGWPDVGNGDDGIPCCMGSALDGPARCTCWTPVYDQEQETPLTIGPTAAQPTMCADCAYRPRSPERQGDPEHGGDEETLQHIAAVGKPFWCHEGMRRPIKYVHPSGAEIPGHPANYQPPMINGRPYQADGSPALMCGGWNAINQAQTKRTTEIPTAP